VYSFPPHPLLLVTSLWLQVDNLSQLATPPYPVTILVRKQTSPKTCPTDVETLTSLMMRDLPSYGNRVIQRARRLDRTVDSFSYVLLAGKPEFTPLPLRLTDYTPTIPPEDPEAPKQVFFTTLERQYLAGKVIELQHYHWLFLTLAPDGWHLVMMFSRIGSTEGHPPTPPRESSNGIIGQAVSLWLRDCNAGAIQKK